MHEELRRASEANAALQRSYTAELARAVKLRERLDTLTLSLRVCPPPKERREPLPVRHLSPPSCGVPYSMLPHGGDPEAPMSDIDAPAAGGAPASARGGATSPWVDSDLWVPTELYEQLQV